MASSPDTNQTAPGLAPEIQTVPTEPILEISESPLTIATIVEPFLPNPNLSQRIERSRIVLLPKTIQSNSGPLPAFPERTSEVYQFLKDKLGTTDIEAAIQDDDYVEAAFHSDTIIFPDLFLAAIDWLPIVIEALHLFIQLHSARKPDVTVKSEIHYKDESGKYIYIKFTGPADSYLRTLERLYPDQKEADPETGEARDND